MTPAIIGEGLQGLITRRGQTITIKTWTAGALDPEYKVPLAPTSTDTSVLAIIADNPRRTVLRTSAGIEVVSDVDVYVHAGNEPALTEGQQPPSVVDEDGAVYEVQLVEQNRLGVRRLRCERERNS